MCYSSYFLLIENESGEICYEFDGHMSDLDADDELNHPVGDEEIHNKRRSQLTVCFAELMFWCFKNKIYNVII